MKFLSVHWLAIGCSLGVLTIAAACGGKSAPAAPTPTTPGVVTPKLEAPAAMTPIGGQQLDTLRPTLSVANAVSAGTVGTVTYEFEVSELDTFPAGSKTTSEKGVSQGNGTTGWTPPSNLIPNFKYFWHARATNGTITTDWSALETFKTLTKGFQNGQTIYDPLTDGTTVGMQIGGSFIQGQGWQADIDGHGIDYTIPTCTSCTVEFDVTNFGRAQGAAAAKDYKWLSMGDGATFNDFFAFREHPWKMHLEQRSDGDGTGMKLIWRNGAAGDGEPGDHERRNDSTVDWSPNVVYHFTVRWTPSGFSVSVGIVGTDGQVTGNREWFSGSFGAAFAPGTHRISLGCRSRSDTMRGAIWRNVKVTPS